MSAYRPISSIWLDVHHFGDERHVLGVAGLAEHPQPFLAEALEAVRRASRFERAAAEDLGARLSDGGRRRAHLLVGLRRARSGHDDHLVAAYSNVADV